jgi:hypothetical protein
MKFIEDLLKVPVAPGPHEAMPRARRARTASS